jgi:hypothetical protein
MTRPKVKRSFLKGSKVEVLLSFYLKAAKYSGLNKKSEQLVNKAYL